MLCCTCFCLVSSSECHVSNVLRPAYAFFTIEYTHEYGNLDMEHTFYFNQSTLTNHTIDFLMSLNGMCVNCALFDYRNEIPVMDFNCDVSDYGSFGSFGSSGSFGSGSDEELSTKWILIILATLAIFLIIGIIVACIKHAESTSNSNKTNDCCFCII